jgi:Zn-dependent protease
VTTSQRVVIAALAAAGVWLIIDRGVLGQDQILFFAALFPSIILHEVSHGWAALRFGDDTAKRAGRLTLNPLNHIDPWGSVLLPALLILTTGAAFGYAKPVPVNPRRMRSPRNHGLLTALAGPATNIVLAVAAAVVLRLLPVPDPTAPSLVVRFVEWVGLANVILAVFNLIPIPPLDGSAVIERVLPARLWPGYLRLRQYSMGLILLVVFVFPGPLQSLFKAGVDLWAKLL